MRTTNTRRSSSGRGTNFLCNCSCCKSNLQRGLLLLLCMRMQLLLLPLLQLSVLLLLLRRQSLDAVVPSSRSGTEPLIAWLWLRLPFLFLFFLFVL